MIAIIMEWTNNARQQRRRVGAFSEFTASRPARLRLIVGAFHPMRTLLILPFWIAHSLAYSNQVASQVRAESPLPFEDFMRKAESVYVAFSPGADFISSGTYHYKGQPTPLTRATEEHKAQLIGLFTDHSSYPRGSVGVSEGPGIDSLIFEFRKGTERLTAVCGWMSFIVTYRKLSGSDRRVYRTYTGWLTSKATSQLRQWREQYAEDKAESSFPKAKSSATDGPTKASSQPSSAGAPEGGSR